MSFHKNSMICATEEKTRIYKNQLRKLKCVLPLAMSKTVWG